MKNLSMFMFFGLAMFVFMACESETENEPQLPLVAEMVEDLSAPNDVIDRTTGQVLEEMPFQYFSLSENRVMTVDESWDLAFKGTTIRTNASKNVSAALVDGIFQEIKEIPETASFALDTETTLAIPTGSGNGWYSYNSTTHAIKPIPGKVILLQTSSGNYAKLEILSYYKGNPSDEELDPLTDEGATYTFQYVLQPNGTTTFE
ncbi:HmuY family protein [Cyclobacterium marinum]|uniref:HmuY protein n=1 Tax=Cyclobacterium marinum (strain ATCC 25205 / DSM 745 / LMG 13164 / NCIMB 1802) TaxID=880070 RepID=G0J4Z0_CYCMS|nr:HmuY family protein [Cyclobacterium marinum]AEL25984.1 hypothetical protein Cycma_2242 [Cyclobacterium marinum DSM 745]MBR9774262.1 hypothetical protein [Cytophagales bacterium]|tara:strand:- start:63921 stop:64532 length:612 start_codon:yes stop_codon:yes gene_type:complete